MEQFTRGTEAGHAPGRLSGHGRAQRSALSFLALSAFFLAFFSFFFFFIRFSRRSSAALLSSSFWFLTRSAAASTRPLTYSVSSMALPSSSNPNHGLSRYFISAFSQ